MAVTLHWFLPTTGDSRSDLSHGDAVGAPAGAAAATRRSGRADIATSARSPARPSSPASRRR